MTTLTVTLCLRFLIFAVRICSMGQHTVYFYRPQTKFAKVMSLHLSVSHSVGGGGDMRGRGACMAEGGMHGGGHAWQCGHAWQGVCMVGGMHGKGACMPCTLPGHYKMWSVNGRAVPILLECILVQKVITSCKTATKTKFMLG